MKLKSKYSTAIIWSILWLLFSLIFAIPWIGEISRYVPLWLAWFCVTGMALIPGVAMAFVNSSLLMDKRPKYDNNNKKLPPISIIVAAYNEEDTIVKTLNSILDQEYYNYIDVIVANDGSTDNTKEVVLEFIKSKSMVNIQIALCDVSVNIGKAGVLNIALEKTKYDYVLTIDADSELHPGALKSIVTKMINKDDTYAAVAGSILCKNYNDSFVTKLQDWDYLLGISAVKRIQSMYKGTLVAQGAFSIYKKSVLEEVGGWPDKIGEDIVLSWSILNAGYYIDHCEQAICWTNVPTTYKIFYRQRKRWARGLIEAFRMYPNLLFRREMFTFFIWYNLMFPYIDLTFLFAFVPGVLIALIFGFHLLAGYITLYLLPITFIYSFIILRIQKRDLKKSNISMLNKNVSYILYMFLYQFIMTPATLSGYLSELFKRKRVWK
jgi:biofilm PGA synthesis N-glycosyltransferase PgaC